MGSIEQEEDLSIPSLPPFPSDIPSAPLLRISLSRLLASDPTEVSRFFSACRDLGFFYLDLRSASSSEDGISGETLLQSTDELFRLGEKVFALPEAEKQKYDLMGENSYFGYKGLGQGVIDAKGTRDRNEFWNISKDDILGLSDPIVNPEILKTDESRALLRTFIEQSHSVVRLVLRLLNSCLGLPEGKMQSLHRLRAQSGDQVRWVRSPPKEEQMDAMQAALGEHTDFGSVTVLFNRLGGLQVLPPGEDEWRFVRPLRGHCVVNLGDAMVKFSEGVLRSNVCLDLMSMCADTGTDFCSPADPSSCEPTRATSKRDSLQSRILCPTRRRRTIAGFGRQ
jgi:isopenicillin N synthase-like dioxygenase